MAEKIKKPEKLRTVEQIRAEIENKNSDLFQQAKARMVELEKLTKDYQDLPEVKDRLKQARELVHKLADSLNLIDKVAKAVAVQEKMSLMNKQMEEQYLKVRKLKAKKEITREERKNLKAEEATLQIIKEEFTKLAAIRDAAPPLNFFVQKLKSLVALSETEQLELMDLADTRKTVVDIKLPELISAEPEAEKVTGVSTEEVADKITQTDSGLKDQGVSASLESSDNVEEIIFTYEGLMKLTVKELKDLARNNEIILKGKSKKEDMVSAILAKMTIAQTESQPPEIPADLSEPPGPVNKVLPPEEPMVSKKEMEPWKKKLAEMKDELPQGEEINPVSELNKMISSVGESEEEETPSPAEIQKAVSSYIQATKFREFIDKIESSDRELYIKKFTKFVIDNYHDEELLNKLQLLVSEMKKAEEKKSAEILPIEKKTVETNQTALEVKNSISKAGNLDEVLTVLRGDDIWDINDKRIIADQEIKDNFGIVTHILEKLKQTGEIDKVALKKLKPGAIYKDNLGLYPKVKELVEADFELRKALIETTTAEIEKRKIKKEVEPKVEPTVEVEPALSGDAGKTQESAADAQAIQLEQLEAREALIKAQAAEEEEQEKKKTAQELEKVQQQLKDLEKETIEKINVASNFEELILTLKDNNKNEEAKTVELVKESLESADPKVSVLELSKLAAFPELRNKVDDLIEQFKAAIQEAIISNYEASLKSLEIEKKKTAEEKRILELEMKIDELNLAVAQQDALISKKYSGTLTGWFRRKEKDFAELKANRDEAKEKLAQAKAEFIKVRFDNWVEKELQMIGVRTDEMNKKKRWTEKVAEIFAKNAKVRMAVGIGLFALGTGLAWTGAGAGLAVGVLTARRVLGGAGSGMGIYKILRDFPEVAAPGVSLSKESEKELAEFAKNNKLGWLKKRRHPGYQNLKADLLVKDTLKKFKGDQAKIDQAIAYYDSVLVIRGSNPAENPVYRALLKARADLVKGDLETVDEAGAAALLAGESVDIIDAKLAEKKKIIWDKLAADLISHEKNVSEKMRVSVRNDAYKKLVGLAVGVVVGSGVVASGVKELFGGSEAVAAESTGQIGALRPEDSSVLGGAGKAGIVTEIASQKAAGTFENVVEATTAIKKGEGVLHAIDRIINQNPGFFSGMSKAEITAWKMEQLKDMGFKFKKGAWGYPFTVHPGANVALEKLADGSYKINMGDTNITKHALKWMDLQPKANLPEAVVEKVAPSIPTEPRGLEIIKNAVLDKPRLSPLQNEMQKLLAVVGEDDFNEIMKNGDYMITPFTDDTKAAAIEGFFDKLEEYDADIPWRAEDLSAVKDASKAAAQQAAESAIDNGSELPPEDISETPVGSTLENQTPIATEALTTAEVPLTESYGANNPFTFGDENLGGKVSFVLDKSGNTAINLTSQMNPEEIVKQGVLDKGWENDARFEDFYNDFKTEASDNAALDVILSKDQVIGGWKEAIRENAQSYLAYETAIEAAKTTGNPNLVKVLENSLSAIEQDIDSKKYKVLFHLAK